MNKSIFGLILVVLFVVGFFIYLVFPNYASGTFYVCELIENDYIIQNSTITNRESNISCDFTLIEFPKNISNLSNNGKTFSNNESGNTLEINNSCLKSLQISEIKVENNLVKGIEKIVIDKSGKIYKCYLKSGI